MILLDPSSFCGSDRPAARSWRAMMVVLPDSESTFKVCGRGCSMMVTFCQKNIKKELPKAWRVTDLGDLRRNGQWRTSELEADEHEWLVVDGWAGRPGAVLMAAALLVAGQRQQGAVRCPKQEPLV